MEGFPRLFFGLKGDWWQHGQGELILSLLAVHHIFGLDDDDPLPKELNNNSN
jgi:hypothetical protein